MRVLNIKLNTSEQISDFGKIGGDSIDKKFGDFVLGDLSSHDQFLVVFISSGAHLFINASKFDGDWGFFYACKTLFVYEFGESGLESEHFFGGGSQKKLNGIKDVALAGAIEAGDGVELGVEAVDDDPVHVGFKTLQNYFLYVHKQII